MHHHSPITPNTGKNLSRAFQIGIVINIVYVMAEALAGIFTNSMGLLSDAGHNLSDVVSLVFALTAYKLSGVPSTRTFTYGYKKGTILISVLNAMILCVAVVFILVESIQKLIDPQPLQGGIISLVAGIGVLINGFTAYLFLKDRKRDLNVKGAFLHMLADALVSVAVVVSGVVMMFTDWYVIDGLLGLAVVVIIIYATYELLRESIRLVLDGVPANVDYDKVVASFLTVDGVVDMHHLHIWALSTTENALTAHVIVRSLEDMESIKKELKALLMAQGIGHATLEFELPDTPCRQTCE